MANEPIDIGELIQFFSKKIRSLLKVLGGFLILGIVVILLTRDHYESNLKFVAESGNSGGNLMSQLGGISGLSLGSFDSQNSSQLSPSLYNEIIFSYPFLWKLSQKMILVNGGEMKLGSFVENNRRPSLKSLIKGYTIGLPSKIFGEKPEPLNLDMVVSDSSVFSSRELVPLFNEFKNMITLESDQSTGAITLVAESLNPEVSAQMAVHLYQLLSDYVVEYKTEKAMQNLNFVESQFEEAKRSFYESQEKLYTFRDRNQHLNMSAWRADEERLQAEYNLANNLYNNLAVQRDQAKLKVQEDIPQLTVINPPVVSYQTSKPNIPLILAVCIFLGLMTGFALILFLYLKEYIFKNG